MNFNSPRAIAKARTTQRNTQRNGKATVQHRIHSTRYCTTCGRTLAPNNTCAAPYTICIKGSIH